MVHISVVFPVYKAGNCLDGLYRRLLLNLWVASAVPAALLAAVSRRAVLSHFDLSRAYPFS